MTIVPHSGIYTVWHTFVSYPTSSDSCGIDMMHAKRVMSDITQKDLHFWMMDILNYLVKRQSGKYHGDYIYHYICHTEKGVSPIPEYEQARDQLKAHMGKYTFLTRPRYGPGICKCRLHNTCTCSFCKSANKEEKAPR